MSKFIEQANTATKTANWSLVNQALQQIPLPTKEDKSIAITATEVTQALNLALMVLREGDFQQRWEVTKFIPKLGEVAIAPLMAILKDEDIEVEVRWFAGRTLGGFDNPQVITTLVEMLQNTEDPDLATVTAEALTHIGTNAIASLTQLLPDPESRLIAVQALAQIRRPQTLEPLLTVVNDPDAKVRLLSIEALGSFHSSEITTVLLSALKDTNAQVRKEAVIALGRQGEYIIPDDLVAAVQPLLYDLNPIVCKESAIAIGKIGTETAIEALFHVLKSPLTPIYLKREVIKALAWSETPLALSYLQKGLGWSDAEICLEIVTRLGRILSPGLQPQAVQILVEFLNSQQFNLGEIKMQQATAQSLGELGQPEAIDPLLQLASVSENRVYLHCITALSKLPNINVQLQQRLTDLYSSPTLRKMIIKIQRELT